MSFALDEDEYALAVAAEPGDAATPSEEALDGAGASVGDALGNPLVGRKRLTSGLGFGCGSPAEMGCIGTVMPGLEVFVLPGGGV